ncbi:hypothetical protein [Lentimonas sp. CC10]|uniref:hypothetical protein n=1 Tax=Lentimonas sp. CC10 TaxID=2676095 RepID=UPI0013894F24|nr:hypothetical protein [Lentimonas sp. CC10]
MNHNSSLAVGLFVLFAVSQAIAQNAPVELPFEADFESDSGYVAGPLLSDSKWNLDQELFAEVFPFGAFGSQSLGFTGNQWLWLNTQGLAEGEVTWIDFYLKPVYAEVDDLPEEIESEQSAVTGFVKVDTEGEVYAVDGDGQGSGQWLPTGQRTGLYGNTSLDWVRLTYRLDYANKQWDLFVDGRMAVTDLGFLDDTVLKLTEFAARGDADDTSTLDYFYTGGVNPLFEDSSNDGLSDAWLTAQGLSILGNQRYGDGDSDGLDNLTEFKLSTRADLADSDGDGVDDGVELANNIDPNNADTDNDGAQDGVELTLGIDPKDPDTDYDGAKDGSEITNGTDPLLFDTDTDGLADSLEAVWALDPLIADAGLARLVEAESGSGVFEWSQSFSAEEDFADGALSGQQAWSALGNVLVAAEQVDVTDSLTEDASFERLAGIGEARQIWISFRAKLVAGELPDVAALTEPVVAIWGAGNPNNISVWDETSQLWVAYDSNADVTQWNDYALYFDYVGQQWLLTQNGILIANDLSFKDEDLIVFSRFKALQGSVLEADAEGERSVASFDDFKFSNAEPVGLDFDGDGLINSLEREAGSDLFAADTDGDGLDDLWEHQNGLDLLTDDAALDSDADGLSNETEFALGSSAQATDSDGDGYADLDEYYAGTNLTDDADAPDAIGLGDWQVADIGSVSGARGYTVDGRYVLYSKGTGVGSSDRHGFFFQDFTGNFSIVTRVHSVEAGKIGVQVRESLEGAAPMHWGYAQSSANYRVYSRTEASGGLSLTPHIPRYKSFPDVYLKMERIGSRFTVYRSSDGENWMPMGDATIDAGDSTLAGIAFASGSNSTEKKAVVEVLSIVRDQDSDGINDNDELSYGTLVNSPDSDGDGVSDYDEIFVIFSDPLVADFDGSSILVASLLGADYSDALGDWYKTGSIVYSRSLRGYLDYSIVTNQSGSFRLDVTGGQYNSYSAEQRFDLNLYIDGQIIGSDYIEAAHPNSGIVSFYLPYLTAGEHDVRVEWLNGELGSSFKLEQIDLLELGGADVDENGVVDWLDSHIQATSDLDDSIVYTAVSPYTLEGDAMHPGFVSINSSYVEDSQNPEPILVQQGLVGKYFAHIPLDPAADTLLDVAEQNGLLNSSKTVVWVPTNLLEAGDVLVREDDSLLLAAYSDLFNTTEPVSIVINDSQGAEIVTYSLSAADAVRHDFDESGDYTVTTTLTVTGGDPLFSTISVSVVSADFGTAPRIVRGNVRGWTVSGLSDEAVVEADTYLNFDEVAAINGERRFNLSSNSVSDATVLARLGEDGPIIARTTVHILVDYDYTETHFLIVDTFEDGTELWSSSISLGGDIPDDLTVNLRIFKAGVTFLDGTVERTVTKADFDELGYFRYYMLHPKSSRGSTCHMTTIYQGGEQISATY